MERALHGNDSGKSTSDLNVISSRVQLKRSFESKVKQITITTHADLIFKKNITTFKLQRHNLSHV